MAARTRRLELGTGVIDMRYENPLCMAEQAAALRVGGRAVTCRRRAATTPTRG
jgi:alkanesulfonate monooxygenase SsuD/methylene tetrahydromethanopterin reductase-like flavin-dependent oxidoreductase (luciferase family)